MEEGRYEFEVLIVGGGPAGLSAALVLGRCRRRVALCDAGRPRNIASRSMHSFLSRDGIPPLEFYRLCRLELEAYRSVSIIQGEVAGALKTKSGFRVKLKSGRSSKPRFLNVRKVLLATGLIDEIPRLKNIEAFYGKSVFHCPYCDGWELRDAPVAVYGRGERGYRESLALLQWTRDLALVTDGPSRLKPEQRERLSSLRVGVYEKKIHSLEGHEGRLKSVRFADGTKIRRAALFFNTPSVQRSRLAEDLGCSFNRKGGVRITGYGKTNIPGLFAAGNILRDVQLAIVAAADGARAAFEINTELQRDWL